jgi:L-phenylalanine/L-methionine N-acetyltransferase
MDIKIRHSEIEDIPSIKSIYEQPSCYAGTLQLPFPSVDKWKKFLGSLSDNFFSLVAEIDGEVVAQIGMEVFSNPRRKHVANIGMAVSEIHQRRGVGSTLLQAMLNLANDWAAVSRIELEVYTDNESALELYKKHGFVIEGTAKKYAFRNGEYADVYFMAKV